MASTNVIKQCEEIEVMSNIYGAEWTTESPRSHRVKIVEGRLEVTLCVTLPSGYPGQAAPGYELSAPALDGRVKKTIHKALDEVYLKHVGEAVLFQWVERTREILQAIKVPKKTTKKGAKLPEMELKNNTSCPEIIHGDVIVDRKSTFQAHAARVESIDDVKAVLDKLKCNRKILNAKHNMFAFRINKKGNIIHEEADDDGEKHAAGRMLHLLQVLDLSNTLVVVTRWYGGIHLGPDRFRHIGNAARQVLIQSGFVKK